MQQIIHDIDETFADRLRSGEEPAFRAIYSLYYQRLYFFALRFVSEADAQDMVAEAFVSLWQKRTDFPEVAPILHYLFVHVRNAAYTLLKREAMKLTRQADILHRLELANEEDLHLEHLQNQLVAEIYREVDQLPQGLRTVFLLSFKEGLKPAAIAKRLGVSVQTVRNQKVSAIRLLRNALGDRAFLLSLLLLVASEG